MSRSIIVAPQWIGDAVMSEPLLARLAARGEQLSVAGDLDQARDHLDASIAVLSRNPAGAPLWVWGLWACVRSFAQRQGS